MDARADHGEGDAGEPRDDQHAPAAPREEDGDQHEEEGEAARHDGRIVRREDQIEMGVRNVTEREREHEAVDLPPREREVARHQPGAGERGVDDPAEEKGGERAARAVVTLDRPVEQARRQPEHRRDAQSEAERAPLAAGSPLASHPALF